MVLKRKKPDEIVPSPLGQQADAPDQGPPPKKTRTNPPRTKAARVSTTDVSTDGPAKKPRAPRKKKATAIAAQPETATAGPSNQPQADSNLPSAPAKRGRKKKVADDEQPGPEKRQAQFRSKCPQNILDRYERGMAQRIFMIDRHRNDGELREEFRILGSTGNVYTVTIDHLPRCNCPDAVRGNHCKHILFALLKVLKVSPESSFWYQKALLTSELEQIFRDAPLAPNASANARVREAYARATGKATEKTAQSSNKRMPDEEDSCPICYDDMHNVAETSLVFCEECGNAVHKECFGEWRKTAQKNGNELTCVYCRARWVVPAPASGSGSTRGGYINLANVAGLNPVRDSSTYYHGPRGIYGYHHYDD